MNDDAQLLGYCRVQKISDVWVMEKTEDGLVLSHCRNGKPFWLYGCFLPCIVILLIYMIAHLFHYFTLAVLQNTYHIFWILPYTVFGFGASLLALFSAAIALPFGKFTLHLNPSNFYVRKTVLGVNFDTRVGVTRNILRVEVALRTTRKTKDSAKSTVCTISDGEGPNHLFRFGKDLEIDQQIWVVKEISNYLKSLNYPPLNFIPQEEFNLTKGSDI